MSGIFESYVEEYDVLVRQLRRCYKEAAVQEQAEEQLGQAQLLLKQIDVCCLPTCCCMLSTSMIASQSPSETVLPEQTRHAAMIYLLSSLHVLVNTCSKMQELLQQMSIEARSCSDRQTKLDMQAQVRADSLQ